jgi:phosphatidate cytidylyltransferase
MNNLLLRGFSGALFVALIISSILISQYSFAVVFAIIAVLSIREFHLITNNTSLGIEVSVWSATLGGLILFFCAFLFASKIYDQRVFSIYGFYLILIFLAELYNKRPNPIHNWAYFLLGQIFIALPFALLTPILFISGSHQPMLLLALFVSICVNDTGAYLVGISIGKHKLLERISPKKTWEGVIGGAIAALISGYIFSLYFHQLTLLQWIIFSELIVVFGTYGDLIESLLKRTVHIKDSGTIIPGHGGLLDRFDSMLLASPIIYIYLSIIQ